MWLPLPENDTSILSLLTDIAELKQEAIRLREKPACTLCHEGDPCWYHRPFAPKCATVISGASRLERVGSRR